MMTDLVIEEVIAIGALTASSVGVVLAQTGPSAGFDITGIVTQFGGLGLAVWLVIHHTTVTIPNLQKQHQLEREAATLAFRAEMETKRQEYMNAVKDLTKEYTAELAIRRAEILEALKRSECRYRQEEELHTVRNDK